MAVQQQPVWMERPTVPLGCPPGLEYLSQLESIIIDQKVSLVEVLTGWDKRNKYLILNDQGHQIFYAFEESSCLMRQCCGPGRGFTMHIQDNNQQEVMRIIRPFQCCAGCCWCASSDCCGFTITVEAPPGNVVGHVRQMGSKWKPHLIMMDANMQTTHYTWGRCCPFQFCLGCMGDVDFPIYDQQTDAQVSNIAKVWTDCAREMFTVANQFRLTFPRDLDVKGKATFLGALFLIDFMLYQHQNNNN